MWVTTKNPQFKHFNFCLNELDDDIESEIMSLLERTPDDFGVTLSANKFSEESIGRLHGKVKKLHKLNVDMLRSHHEGDGDAP